MADIDVTFASNAGTVARDIDHAAAATTKAAGATTQLAAAARVQAPALRSATDQVKKFGDEAEKSAAKHVTLAKAAKLAGAGHAFKEASFIGNAIGGGGAAGVAMVGVVAAGAALHLLTHSIETAADRLTMLAERTMKLTEMQEGAAETMGKAGQKGAAEFGPNLRQLISEGGGLKELADEMAKRGHPLADAQQAVLNAHRQFPGHERGAISLANDASQLTGQPLSKSVENMEGMHPDALKHVADTLTSLYSIGTGKLKTRDETLAAVDNIHDNPLIDSLNRNSRGLGRIDLSNQDNIANAPGQTARDLSTALDPLADLIRKNNIILQRHLDVALEAYEKQANGLTIGDRESFVSFFDRMIRGKDSLAGKVHQAQEALVNAPGGVP